MGQELERNVASQSVLVFAFTASTGAPVTGGAAAITANIAIDGGGAAGTDDTNPTETQRGHYVFNLTQAETNAADYIDLYPTHSTAGVEVVVVGGSRILTRAVGYNLLNLATINAEVDTAITDASLSTFDHTSHNVTVNPAQAPGVAPTPGTFDDLLLKGSMLPAAPAGEPGGLATYHNVAVFPSFVVTGTPAANAFDTDLTDADGKWNGYKVFFPRTTSATVPGETREITAYVQANGRMTFSGGTGSATAPFSAAPTVGDIGIILAYGGAS